MSDNSAVYVSAGPAPWINMTAVFSKSRITSMEYIYKQNLLPRSTEKRQNTSMARNIFL